MLELEELVQLAADGGAVLGGEVGLLDRAAGVGERGGEEVGDVGGVEGGIWAE